jgi:hypothetical protein
MTFWISGRFAVQQDVGVAALLEVRIEDRFAGRAPARLPLPEQVQDSPVNIHLSLCSFVTL